MWWFVLRRVFAVLVSVEVCVRNFGWLCLEIRWVVLGSLVDYVRKCGACVRNFIGLC